MNPITYEPRSVLGLGVARFDWTAKVYGIFARGMERSDLPADSVLWSTLKGAMAEMAGQADHDYGFAIFHFAQDGFYLLLTRFNNANNLVHRVFSISVCDGELALSPLEDSRIIACVWEIQLLNFEAQAWIDCVLSKHLTKSTGEDYLARFFVGEV